MKIAISYSVLLLVAVLTTGWGAPLAAADITRAYPGTVSLKVDMSDVPSG